MDSAGHHAYLILMIPTYSALFCLLRSALWGQPVAERKLEMIDSQGWERVLTEAQRQTVGALAFEAVCLLPRGMHPPQHIINRWLAISVKTDLHNQQLLSLLPTIAERCAQADIDPMIYKGPTVGQYYPNPLTRESGDIDLCVANPVKLQRAAHLLSAGAGYKKQADGSRLITCHDIDIELHGSMFSLLPRRQEEDLRRLQEATNPSVYAIPNTALTMRTPEPTVALAMYNLHILKHAAGFGVGLRQLCDMAMAYHHLLDKADSQWLRDFYTRHRLRKWTLLVESMLYRRLGLPASATLFLAEEGVSPLDDSSLLRIIVEGGNFGLRSLSASKNKPHRHRLMTVGRNLWALYPYAPLNVGHISRCLIKRWFKGA
ncbi:MAG: nucleotidyltransferase family protein [Bacteroidales bacterium]|nr:nucleotidyltransferase family protein [Bacteroidales bacterium]